MKCYISFPNSVASDDCKQKQYWEAGELEKIPQILLCAIKILYNSVFEYICSILYLLDFAVHY